MGIALASIALIASATASAGPSTSILTVADFNQDGVSDLLAEKIGGGNEGLLWVMLIDGADGSADGELLGNEFPFQLQENYEFLAVGNFNANLDGQSQIAARKTAVSGGEDPDELGGVRIWDLADDAATVSGDIEGKLVAIPDQDYSLVGVADMDGNGVDDFVFIHDYDGSASEGLIRVYLMNSLMEVDLITHPLAIPATDPNTGNPIEVFGVADVTGDDNADIVVSDRIQQSLRILAMRPSLGADPTDGITVDEQLFAYLVAPSDYDFVGFAMIDDGSRADLVFVKNGEPNQGLIRAQLIPAIASPGTPGELSSFHPVNLGADFDYLGAGLVDSDSQTDIVVTRNAGTSEGQVEALLLDIDTEQLLEIDQVSDTTFPVLIPPAEWDDRKTGPVSFP